MGSVNNAINASKKSGTSVMVTCGKNEVLRPNTILESRTIGTNPCTAVPQFGGVTSIICVKSALTS